MKTASEILNICESLLNVNEKNGYTTYVNVLDKYKADAMSALSSMKSYKGYDQNNGTFMLDTANIAFVEDMLLDGGVDSFDIYTNSSNGDVVWSERRYKNGKRVQ